MLSYKEALDYLNSLINYEKKPDVPYTGRSFNLERMRSILSNLGNPHQSLKCVHIAGTKGKGSTAAMIASMLKAGGYRVGLYTSPHLISPRERIRIGSHLISEEEFASLISRIKEVIEKSSHRGNFSVPTFFEVYTSLAFTYFNHKKVDIAVIEVGLGGRLDATNVIEPLVGVITPISLDHTNILGKSITSIAREKAGIIKPGSRIITSPQRKSVFSLLQKACEEKNATLYRVGEDITFKVTKATSCYYKFSIQGMNSSYPDLLLPLVGEHQLWNATTAVGTIELLANSGFPIFPQEIEEGLRKVKWRGRIQILERNPTVLVDCAHNSASARHLARFLEKFFVDKGKKLTLILAVLKNKDIEGIGKALCPLTHRVIITRANSPRALPPGEILARIKMYCPFEPVIEDNVKRALERAKEMIEARGDIICVTGSIYIVGEVLGLPQYRNSVNNNYRR